MPALLFDAGDWFAVDKPAGWLVIPGRSGEEEPAIRSRLEAREGKKIWVVHRLDRDTSGVLLFARTAQAHRELSMAFEAGKIRKIYLALVEGRLAEPAEVDLALVPARRGRMRPARAGEPGKKAVTLLRPLQQLGAGTLVEVEPLTGRTHQIRVHLKAIGHPLLVDHQYAERQALQLPGAAEPVLTRTPLHAARLSVPQLEGISPALIEAPLPEDMARTVELLKELGAAPIPSPAGGRRSG